MKGQLKESDSRARVETQYVPTNVHGDPSGLQVHIINGVEYFRLEDAQRLICAEIAKLPQETRPNVLAAQDARKIVNELTQGLGADMERLKSEIAQHLTDIRQSRMSVVGETRQILDQLKDIRQFFLGSDYHEQVDRLTKFVDLCERLQALKKSGFLDAVADTMLKLAL